MRNLKSFWSKKSAEDFVTYLKGQKKKPQIWQERDALNNCTRYIVKWN